MALSENSKPPHRSGSIAKQTTRESHKQVEQVLINLPSSLPDADELKKLDEMCPGFALSIKTKIEETHKFAMEEAREDRKSDASYRKTGQWMGLFLSVLFLAGSIYAAHIHESWPAVVLGGVPLATLIRHFLKPS